MFMLKDGLSYLLGMNGNNRAESTTTSMNTGGTTAGTTNQNEAYVETNQWFYDDQTINYEYFEQLERTNGMRVNEMIQFYCGVRQSYEYEVLSCNNNLDELRTTVESFIDRFLFYIYEPPVINTLACASSEGHQQQQHQSTMAGTEDTIIEVNLRSSADDITSSSLPALRDEVINFPTLYYAVPESDSVSDYCMPLDGDDCTAYLVSSKIDLIYASVFEQALIDILRRKQQSLLAQKKFQQSDYMTDRLRDLDMYAQVYREQAVFTYRGNGCDAPTPQTLLAATDHASSSMATTEKLVMDTGDPGVQSPAPHTPQNYDSRKRANEMIIYTKRSSLFYRTCVDTHRAQSQLRVAFTEDMIRAAPVSFQQVLFMCGQQGGFIARHAPQTPHKDESDFVTVRYSETGDWVALPVWHYLLWCLTQQMKTAQ